VDIVPLFFAQLLEVTKVISEQYGQNKVILIDFTAKVIYNYEFIKSQNKIKFAVLIKGILSYVLC
jgi:hypothetical protein